MARTIDKVILTNLSALKSKYGTPGFRKIQTAVGALIKADKARGLDTRLIAVDDSAVMKKLSAPAVTANPNPKHTRSIFTSETFLTPRSIPL